MPAPKPSSQPRRKEPAELLQEGINRATVDVAQKGCDAIDEIAHKVARAGADWFKRKLIEGLSK